MPTNARRSRADRTVMDVSRAQANRNGTDGRPRPHAGRNETPGRSSFSTPHIRGAGSAGRRQRLGLEHRIGYAYGMNYFDATKCSADPRSVVASDEVYSALGVIRG